MFLRLQEHIQSAAGRPAGEIDLPMSRTDIADFVGLSLAAVSRGFRSLLSCGIVSIKNRRDVKIIDRKAFEALAGNVELL
ncbi:hypothetical protein OHAE_5234 [Ochrobactrum soli]|uniref:HTH crp-type domain-containing protein n=2 Tax=Ochrobactrum soli TaxID=2448455 RepID=A0A2P9HEU6_9HYPH|nr:hypothetical protein OHAE_5234 [[Ochrobactrum] soli]